MARKVAQLLAAFALLVPGAAHASFLTIEALWGFARPPEANFRAAVGGTTGDRDLSDDSSQLVGGDVLLNLGGFQLGAIVDTTVGGDDVPQTVIGALGGLRLGDKLRLDLLAEAGGHRFGSVLDNKEVLTGSSADQWLFYVGLRPGIAYRIGSGSAGLLVGIWGFARWDVNDKNVPVTVGGATGTGDLELGGTTIGGTLRVGIDL